MSVIMRGALMGSLSLSSLIRGVPFEASLRAAGGGGGGSALAFVRSTTQPAAGSAPGETPEVPAGSDPLWFSVSGGEWTQIVGSFEEAPFTFTAASPSDVSVAGNTATRTSAGGDIPGGTVNVGPTYNSGARLRYRYVVAGKAYYGGIITPTQSDFYGYWTAGGSSGYTGGTGATQAANDELEMRRAADGTSMSAYQNDILVGSEGPTAYAGATATTPGIGTFWLTDQGGEVTVLGWAPIGSDVPVKVAETSPDGVTWRAPTAGDTQLRVSNDAGITPPSVVISG